MCFLFPLCGLLANLPGLLPRVEFGAARSCSSLVCAVVFCEPGEVELGVYPRILSFGPQRSLQLALKQLRSSPSVIGPRKTANQRHRVPRYHSDLNSMFRVTNIYLPNGP